jgi:hypothetical protein
MAKSSFKCSDVDALQFLLYAGNAIPIRRLLLTQGWSECLNTIALTLRDIKIYLTIGKSQRYKD